MNAIKVHRKLESHVIDLPELEPLVGRMVEITIVAEPDAPSASRDLSALDRLASRGTFDADSVSKLREASRL